MYIYIYTIQVIYIYNYEYALHHLLFVTIFLTGYHEAAWIDSHQLWRGKGAFAIRRTLFRLQLVTSNQQSMMRKLRNRCSRSSPSSQKSIIRQEWQKTSCLFPETLLLLSFVACDHTFLDHSDPASCPTGWSLLLRDCCGVSSRRTGCGFDWFALAKLAKNVPSNELLDASDFIDTPGLELKGYDESLLETRQGAWRSLWLEPAPDIRYSLNARLRDAIQSIIACETHEDLPQRLGAIKRGLLYSCDLRRWGWVMTPRCIETLAEFSTPENHQRIDEAGLQWSSWGSSMWQNLWGKSHDCFVAGCVFFFFFFWPNFSEKVGGEWKCKQLDLKPVGFGFRCFWWSWCSSWTKWAG